MMLCLVGKGIHWEPCGIMRNRGKRRERERERERGAGVWRKEVRKKSLSACTECYILVACTIGTVVSPLPSSHFGLTNTQYSLHSPYLE